ncbi:MAG: FlgO family outer membrane protein [Thermodesulfovibrionales bacterium]|nr:FlgO family outer membrane protein [Thermodesulfovibrionales bacterium]
MRKRHFIRPFLICIISAILSISISQSSLAYEKEIKSISSTITENITKAGKKTVAVVDFTDLQGNITELGRFLAEELSVNLTTMARGFEVIDRTHLKSILTEHKLSMSGLVDPKTVKQLGKIAGVDTLVTGSVTPFGDSIRVSVKVIATDTARVIGASSGDIAKTKAIEELMAKGIETGAPTHPAPKPLAKVQQKVEAQGFTFELTKCKLSGGSVRCEFLVTNNDKDRNLTVYGSYYFSQSRLIDNFGNAYHPVDVYIANIKGGKYAEATLVSGVPTKSGVYFEGVSNEATEIALLEVGCATGRHFTVQFRNIPLSR